MATGLETSLTFMIPALKKKLIKAEAQRDRLLTAAKEALDLIEAFKDPSGSLQSLKLFLRSAIADAEKR